MYVEVLQVLYVPYMFRMLSLGRSPSDVKNQIHMRAASAGAAHVLESIILT